MDITPQLLKDVKFSESWRGYDRDEVDEFLERVGAGVAQVQGRLREAVDRAESAEARAVALGSRSEAEETLRRTLVLAQRTADAAVAEANEAAAGLVAEAEARAQRAIAEAEAHAAALRAEAEAEVRRVIESTRAPLVEEIQELERVRNFLRDDLSLLEGHLAEQRERLHTQVEGLRRLLDEPDALRMSPIPETSGVDPAPVLAAGGERPASAAAPTPEPEAAPRPLLVERVSPEPPVAPRAERAAEAEAVLPEPSWADLGALELSPSRPSARVEAADDGGPATRPVPMVDLSDDAGSDEFLEQLRRAVDDEADSDQMTAFFDQDDDESPRSRFGRRR